MTRKWLITLGAICLIGVGLVVLVLRATRGFQFDTLAKSYLQNAIANTSPSTTAADAKAWLQRNGFQVALFSQNEANERQTRTSDGYEVTNIVDGYRWISPASTLHSESWMHLVFVFRSTPEPCVPGSFVRVELDNFSPTKWMKSEFTRRSATSRLAPAAVEQGKH